MPRSITKPVKRREKDMEEILIGYKFLPTDSELIQYLVCKAKEEALPWEGVVKDCDVYGKEPSELFEGSEENVLYFFTKLKKKHGNGSRIDRVTATMGTWKGQDKAKPIIKDVDGTTGTGEGDDQETGLIGRKRTFTYRMKSDAKAAKAKSGWSMTEYNLDGTNLQRAKVKDYVICRIKRQKQEEIKLESQVKVMQAEECKVTVTPALEDCNTITHAMEPILQDCSNLITEAIEFDGTTVLTQPEEEEDCMDWLNDFDCSNLITQSIEFDGKTALIEAEDCSNLITQAIEFDGKTVLMQAEDCSNLSTQAIEFDGKTVSTQPEEDCNWLNDFATQLFQNQEHLGDSEILMLPNIFYADSWSLSA
ncbi:NAC domain-containing protein 2-like [Cornus florida]|uniref:NAC domain-containing protein 2-like n=1 Tax=Cornus florida TaxID=4283 RepID=UPI00289C38C6|nr:NAC domain-containing protein 2-like [Cornus florida]